MKVLEILKEKYTSLAFKELDKYSNGSAVKSLEIMNKLFRELEELNNRSCKSCKYWGYKDDITMIETCNFGLIDHSYNASDFCCNRYEKKDSK